MKKILLVVFVAIFLVSAVSIGVMAKGDGNGFKGMGAMKALNLTFEQQQKILTLRQNFQKDTMNIRFELQKKHLELQQLWQAKSLDQNAIDVKTKEVNALKVQLTAKQRELQDKIKSILTPEQQKLLDKKEFGFGRRMGMMKRGGMNPIGMGL